jgi:hypothetical protein
MPKGATYTQSRPFPQIYESEAWVRQHGHDSIVGQWLSSCLFLSLFPVVLDRYMILGFWKFKAYLAGSVSLSEWAKPLPPYALSLFQWSQISPGDRNETEPPILVTHLPTLKTHPPALNSAGAACDCLHYTRVKPRAYGMMVGITWLDSFITLYARKPLIS